MTELYQHKSAFFWFDSEMRERVLQPCFHARDPWPLDERRMTITGCLNFDQQYKSYYRAFLYFRFTEKEMVSLWMGMGIHHT